MTTSTSDRSHPANLANIFRTGESGRIDPVATATSVGLALTFGLLSSGLLLAMMGWHHAWLQAPLTLAIGYGIFTGLPRASEASRPKGVAIALAVVVVGVVGINLSLQSELVIAGRDGATYANTASFLVDDGGLFPEAIEDPFIGQDLEFKAPGFVVRSDGTFWQQFLHAPSAVFAFFGELFGKSAIFGVNAVFSGLGVLTVFSLAARLLPGWWALLAAAGVSVSLPFAYYARGTFSEMMTLVLSMGGLWVAHVALTTSKSSSLVAGALLGGATLVRVDAWMMGIVLALVYMSAIWMKETDAREALRFIFAGYMAVATIGLFDLAFFSEPYITNLGLRFPALVMASVVLWVLAPAAATPELQRLFTAFTRRVVTVERVVVIGIVAASLFLWFGRSLLPPSMTGGYGIGPLQIREGVAVEPARSYTELSVWWIVWYLGIPAVVLSIVGLVNAARRVLRPGSAGLRLVLAAALVPAVTYLVRPSINPDHIWASRRFLPVVIPGVLIFAMAGAHWLAARAPQGAARRAVAAGLAVAAIAPVGLASRQLFFAADRPGLEAQLEALCDQLGDSDSVLIIDDDPALPLSWRLGPPLRSWCNVSVAGIAPGIDYPVEPDAVIAISAKWLPTTAEHHLVLAAEAWESRLLGRPFQTEVRSLEVWVDLDCCGG